MRWSRYWHGWDCARKTKIHTGSHQLTLCTCLCVQEKSLPGVVMALVCNVFEMLYQLANLDESRYSCTISNAYLYVDNFAHL